MTMTRITYMKRKLILQGAASVFIRKGFNATTMQDIVEECRISRGGLYRYYSSTEDIFQALLQENSNNMERYFEGMVLEGKDFIEMIDSFFAEQKTELLHMEKSLMTATYEFFLSHKSDRNKEFLQQQYDQSVYSLTKVMEHGISQNEIRINNVGDVVKHIILSIEGIRMYAMSVGISEETVNGQFDLLRRLLFTSNMELEAGGD